MTTNNPEWALSPEQSMNAQEYILAWRTGWTLAEIRQLRYRDVIGMLGIDKANRSIQAQSDGKRGLF